MNTPLFIANWKMNQRHADAVHFAKQLVALMPAAPDFEVCLAPSFPSLPAVHKIIDGTTVKLAAQNMYCEEKGAFTGEVSPVQLTDAGCTYAIIGHSERRTLFGEDDALIARKLQAAQQHNIIPILCVGESAEDYMANLGEKTVRTQIEHAISSLLPQTIERMVIAYEPVWAIGTGKSAEPDYVEQMHAAIRSWVTPSTRIVYGGSVDERNSSAFLATKEVNGLLVGYASLTIAQFSSIIPV